MASKSALGLLNGFFKNPLAQSCMGHCSVITGITGSHDDYWDRCEAEVLLFFLLKFYPAHYWHHEIHENEIGEGALDERSISSASFPLIVVLTEYPLERRSPERRSKDQESHPR